MVATGHLADLRWADLHYNTNTYDVNVINITIGADHTDGTGGMEIMPSQDAIAEFNMLDLELPAGLRHLLGPYDDPFAQERHPEVPRSPDH